MKNLMIALMVFTSLVGCKKIKEDIQEKRALDIITSGQWKVSVFKSSTTDYTTDFAGYSFQFKTNETVDAIKNSVVQKTGSWYADATNYTINSTFPSDAAYPLPLLNGVWQLVDADQGGNYVKATQMISGELYTLQLDKV
jgi:hypothetical protein